MYDNMPGENKLASAPSTKQTSVLESCLLGVRQAHELVSRLENAANRIMGYPPESPLAASPEPIGTVNELLQGVDGLANRLERVARYFDDL